MAGTEYRGEINFVNSMIRFKLLGKNGSNY